MQSELTVNHMGDPYTMNEDVIYIASGKEVKLPKLVSKLSNYSKIDKKRSYRVSADKCLGESSALFMLLGGGNCSNVCEAYAKVDFNENGNISSISGLTYQEYDTYIKSITGN